MRILLLEILFPIRCLDTLKKMRIHEEKRIDAGRKGYGGGGVKDITYPLVSFSSISSDIPLSRRRTGSEWL